MSSPFVGQLMLVPYTFAPAGWMFCQGQLIAISQNDTLFNLIGTTYGGDGQTTFGLPDLQGRTPIHMGPGYVLGQPGGSESVTLTTAQMPAHTHPATATSNAQTAQTPQGNVLATATFNLDYSSATLGPNTAMSAKSMDTQGGSQPHENRQPYLVMNWIISMFGIYPSQG